MPKSDLKLSTKYENDDPDFVSEASSSAGVESRRQPIRSKNKTTSVADKSETDQKTLSEKSETQKTSKIQEILPYKVSISSSDLVSSHQKETSSQNSNQKSISDSQTFLKSPLQFTNKETMATQTIDDNMIRQIIQTILSTQHETIKTSVPKVDLQKLSMKNYVDWSKKMKYALKLNKLWVEPTQLPRELREEDVTRNEKAVLFMACYLDDQNASLINESNEKCFISAWNNIQKFHQPRSATVLTDIHKQIQMIKHQPGQSIESHLMKLENQFTRFHEINKKLDDEHLVALILASVSDSPDFANVMHSAMWEDESTLTIAKVKSVLISTQRRQNTEREEEAHHSKSKPQFNATKSLNRSKQHFRRPRNPNAGWRCPDCEMDNHSSQDCFKKISANHQQNRQGITIQPKRANQAEEQTQIVNVARAYAGRNQQSSPRHEPYRAVQRHVVNSARSIKNRLGDPVESTSPYRNILPRRSIAEDQDDILDINFNPNYEFEEISYGDFSSGINTKIKTLNNSLPIFSQNTLTCKTSHEQQHEQKYLNNFNLLNFKVSKNFHCNQISNSNKSQMNSNSESVWIVDSGATLHMCNSSELLSNFISRLGNNVIISDGSTIPIHGYGTLTIFLKDEQSL